LRPRGRSSARWLWKTLYHTNKTPHSETRMMRILNQKEVEGIVSRGRKAPEHEITAILDELEIKHPDVYRVIYDEPSDAIATINKDMANLYLDLSCDVVVDWNTI
jgi:DNA-binding LacI/PurR family transcriptional regulator